jgi:hypothetical protein
MQSPYSYRDNLVSSTITKSNSSSICSILRDSSRKRLKRKNSVKFDDFPTVFDKPHPSSNEPSEKISPIPVRRAQSYCKIKEPEKGYSKRLIEATDTRKETKIESGKKTFIKVVKVREAQSRDFAANAPQLATNTVSHVIRTADFYEKLNRFYNNTPKIASEKEIPKMENCVKTISLCENSKEKESGKNKECERVYININELIANSNKARRLRPCSGRQGKWAQEQKRCSTPKLELIRRV